MISWLSKNIKIREVNSDHIGIISSILCLSHCLLTPLLIIFQLEILTIKNGPNFLWNSLNFIFLIISLFAVKISVKKTLNNYIKFIMSINWFLLFAFILNENLGFLSISEIYIYISSISLCFLHIYNLKYCRCDDENCCVNQKLEN